MIARRVAGALLVPAVVAAAAVPASAGKAKPVRKTVKVQDYSFAPETLKVPRRTTVVWKWPSEEGDSHDVKLTKKRPKGVKGWQSEIAAGNYDFKRRLRVKGRYVVICSLHPTQMRQTIVVR